MERFPNFCDGGHVSGGLKAHTAFSPINPVISNITPMFLVLTAAFNIYTKQGMAVLSRHVAARRTNYVWETWSFIGRRKKFGSKVIRKSCQSAGIKIRLVSIQYILLQLMSRSKIISWKFISYGQHQQSRYLVTLWWSDNQEVTNQHTVILTSPVIIW